VNVYMHTASKYDDCRTLHFPHATCNIQFDWICQGNPHDHHSLMPCLPYRVPPSSNNYDTYADFRSKSLDWSINVIVKNRNSKVRTIVINHRINSSPRFMCSGVKGFVFPTGRGAAAGRGAGTGAASGAASCTGR